MKRMGHRSIVPLVLGHAARGVTDIHYDTDDVWAYASDTRVALEGWSQYLKKTIPIDDRQLSFDLVRPAALRVQTVLVWRTGGREFKSSLRPTIS